jgi:Na+/melibiose symporter-like transporter
MNRDARLLIAATGVSACGDMLLMIPLALELQRVTGSAVAVSALFLALWGPVVLLGGVAGLAADRIESRRLLGVASAAQAVVALALTLALAPAAILPLVVLLGALTALAQPAEFSLVPAIAGDGDALAALNGHVETARYAGMTAGPLLGGVLAGAGLTRLAILLDVVSFAAVALAALALRARREPRPAGALRDDGDEGRARDGAIAIARDRELALPVAAALASLLFFTISAAAEPFFVRDVLHAGGAGYGLLMSVWMLGMVAGAALVAPRVAPERLAGATVLAIGLQGASMLAAALAGSLVPVMVGVALGGTAQGAKNVSLRTLLHVRVAEGLRGRAFAAFNAGRNGMELGALLAGGLLVGAIGSRAALAISGAVPFAIAAAALLLLTTIARRVAAGAIATRRILHAHVEG